MYGCYVEVVFHFVAKAILFLCVFSVLIYIPTYSFIFKNVFYYIIPIYKIIIIYYTIIYYQFQLRNNNDIRNRKHKYYVLYNVKPADGYFLNL